MTSPFLELDAGFASIFFVSGDFFIAAVDVLLLLRASGSVLTVLDGVARLLLVGVVGTFYPAGDGLRP